jgi:hypothetical protein
LSAEDSLRHLETARNGAHYVFSLVRQIFAALGENSSAVWVDSLEPHFIAYFVSRRLSESLRKAPANDEGTPVSLPDSPSPGLCISLPLAAPEGILPSAANHNTWSHSSEMLKALSLILKRSSAASRPDTSAANAFSLMQNAALVRFVEGTKNRLDYDAPREADYVSLFGCVFQALHGIVGPALEDELREGGGKRVVPIGASILDTLKQMFD